jgi:hypothetical protein
VATTRRDRTRGTGRPRGICARHGCTSRSRHQGRAREQLCHENHLVHPAGSAGPSLPQPRMGDRCLPRSGSAIICCRDRLSHTHQQARTAGVSSTVPGWVEYSLTPRRRVFTPAATRAAEHQRGHRRCRWRRRDDPLAGSNSLMNLQGPRRPQCWVSARVAAGLARGSRLVRHHLGQDCPRLGERNRCYPRHRVLQSPLNEVLPYREVGRVDSARPLVKRRVSCAIPGRRCQLGDRFSLILDMLGPERRL